ncbi:MAG: Flp family type IVb pilin [bacterium]
MIDSMLELPSVTDDESGQGMVEYGLIVGLIAIIVIAVFVALGPQIRNMFSNTVDQQSVGEGQSALSSAIYE